MTVQGSYPPIWKATTTKSAPASAFFWSVKVSALAFAPSVEISLLTTMALSSSLSRLISMSAMVAPERAGRCSTSPTMFFMNTVEPAPINVILGSLAMSTSGIGIQAISKAARTSR
ncbi:hypothetical protein D3C86_1714590 [compost metagenome]